MSKQVRLRVEQREVFGKGASRQLRREGKVPANVYGHGVEPVAVQADRRELEQLVGGISVDNTLVDLAIGGGRVRSVLIREIQRHPYRSDILHVDFFAIRADEKIRVAVPLHVTGTPAGVRNSGGTLQQSRHEIEIECLPKDIPERFEVDVSGLEIGDSVHVEDVDTGAFEPLEDPGLTVCTILAPRVVAVEAEEVVEEIVAEPEVITSRKEADEDEDED